jgi:hypothetical protein
LPARTHAEGQRAGPAAEAAASEAAGAEAARRFELALRLVNAGDLSGGLAEFRETHALVPSPVTLYNLGLVCAALERPVEALQWLDAALMRPGLLSPEEAARAQAVRHEQAQHIGYVELHVSVTEGSVEVDNVEVARLPLQGPLQVATGAHVVGILAQGHAPARKEVIVAGLRHAALSFTPVPIDGRLAHIELSSALPGADVYVDGERIGKTPLDASITVVPGTRSVRVARRGYVAAEQSVVLGDGARAALTLNPVLDATLLPREGGALQLASSEPLSVVSVDGVPHGVIDGALHLPSGPHRVHVERGGFMAAERDVSVPLGATVHLPVVLEPTPATRAAYIERAQHQRRVRGAMLGVGAAALIGGVVMALIYQSEISDARASLRVVNRDWELSANGTCDHRSELSSSQLAHCAQRLDAATTRVDHVETWRIVGWSLAGVGAATALTAAILLWHADDPQRYERPRTGAPRALPLAPQLGFGQNGLQAGVSGRF